VKDVAGKAIVQIVKATGDNKQAFINLRPEQLDVNGGFRYVRLTLTVGAAASLISASLLGVHARQGTAADSNQAGVVQTIA
jgi:predicted metal-dependent phosphotriesterase family hydrolase